MSGSTLKLLGSVAVIVWLLIATVTAARLSRRVFARPHGERRLPALRWGAGVGLALGLVMWLSSVSWSGHAGLERGFLETLGDAVANLAMGLLAGEVLALGMLEGLRRKDRGRDA
ncbi:MAG: hypothetical protein ABFC80_05205 [Coriobacteriales bacterium]|nr:hypothetical protein [Actinomycetes bacterium]